MIWTLSLDATHIYAVLPLGAFAADAYQKLRQFLKERLAEGVERVSIPGIIVGQMQRYMDNYSYLARHLAKIRTFIAPSAIADGWGQVIPIQI